MARRGRLPEWTCREHLRERGPRSSHSAAACCLLPTAYRVRLPRAIFFVENIKLLCDVRLTDFGHDG